MSEQCSKRVSDGSFRGHQCERAGKVQDAEGNWWCTQHSPAKVAERRAAATSKYNADRDAVRASGDAVLALRVRLAKAAGFETPPGHASRAGHRWNDPYTGVYLSLAEFERVVLALEGAS
jgi:hypothetical protein